MLRQQSEQSGQAPSYSSSRGEVPKHVDNTVSLPLETAVDEAITSADEELTNFESDQIEFSKPAYRLLRKTIEANIRELILGAAREAKKDGVDNISQLHVVNANQQISRGSGRKSAQFVGAIGGIIFGIGSSLAVNMVSAGGFLFGQTIAALILCVVGIGMLVYQFGRD